MVAFMMIAVMAVIAFLCVSQMISEVSERRPSRASSKPAPTEPTSHT